MSPNWNLQCMYINYITHLNLFCSSNRKRVLASESIKRCLYILRNKFISSSQFHEGYSLPDIHSSSSWAIFQSLIGSAINYYVNILSNFYFKNCVCVHLVAQFVWLCTTPWTVAQQAPLAMEILLARLLEWVPVPSSRGSSQPRDWTQFSHIADGFFTVWATREAPDCTLMLIISWVFVDLYLYLFKISWNFHESSRFLIYKWETYYSWNKKTSFGRNIVK